MRVTVDHELCIGCNACEATAPEVFRIEDDGLSWVLMDPVAAEADLQTRVEEARDECPTEAIETHPDDADIPEELLASIKSLAENRG